MTDKSDRDPFEDRYGASESEGTAETSEVTKTSKTEKSESDGVRSRTNVNMYLDDDLVKDLRLLYAELNAQWLRTHEKDMPKNDVFYPAVVKAACEGKDIKEVIDL